MQIGMIGLGRMGANLSRRLMKHGHEVVVHDQSAYTVKSLAGDGAKPASSLADVVKQLTPPRAVWVMLPAGEATETTIGQLSELLGAGDTVIDGGNTFWKDDLRRAKALKARGLHHIDVGTSGGVLGAASGYCLMIGGDKDVVARLAPIFVALSPGGDTPAQGSTAPQGWLHVGPNGAGHFVKMVHNGIEYGLMQAYAEGFQILAEANDDNVPEAERLPLKIDEIAEVWRHGSIVESRLLDVTAAALRDDAKLKDFSGRVDDTGEGRWTIQTAIERAIPAMTLTAALYARFRSRREANFADKVISAMRKGFGGHGEAKGKS
ncbi:MAG: decarboxylating 6-phosphogluconate dehydrogenase [Pseudolabrys sp.]|nr:decarboxylating 6-phosphogluconate dehydrogenase [Pseudolabrys sp.]MDP2294435.1 decarboxylating 6-phosphogluconate dehydrogenase [Pseudolabrys sp.]